MILKTIHPLEMNSKTDLPCSCPTTENQRFLDPDNRSFILCTECGIIHRICYSGTSYAVWSNDVLAVKLKKLRETVKNSDPSELVKLRIENAHYRDIINRDEQKTMELEQKVDRLQSLVSSMAQTILMLCSPSEPSNVFIEKSNTQTKKDSMS